MTRAVLLAVVFGLTAFAAQAEPKVKSLDRAIILQAQSPALPVVGVNAGNANWDQVLDKPKDQNAGN
jgi:hypothetical protein